MITIDDYYTLYIYLQDKLLEEGSNIDIVRSKLKLITEIDTKQKELRDL